MRDGALLAARLIIAGCVLPAVIAHATNISGFALSFWMKGMPASHAVATACVMAEAVGVLFLLLGVVPRVTASALITSLVITTGTFHRFWDFVGAARPTEQAIFIGNLAVIAGLIYYANTGPGDLSWRELWSRIQRPTEPGEKPKTPRARVARA